jgi:hypothetical protein
MRVDVQAEQPLFVFPVLSMPYTRYFLFAAALPLLVVMALGWYVQPLSGDLTRLGHLPERDFGWRAPQARVPVAPHDPQAKPVVAVLGDSFSERNIWQSMAMAQAGVPFVSFDWKGVGGAACVGPWMAAVHAAYPTVRVVVVETVERMFVKRFAAADDTCLALAPLQALHYEAGDTPASRDTEWHLALPDAVYAWRASWSSLRAFERQTHTGGAYVAPLVRRDLFSSKRSDLLLFYEDDLLKRTWRADDLQLAARRIQSLQSVAHTSGLTWQMLVVPDKSTVYAAYVKQALFDQPVPDVWQALSDQHIAHIDIRQALSSAMPEHVDLYLPDDTHVGVEGYRIMGGAVAKALPTF